MYLQAAKMPMLSLIAIKIHKDADKFSVVSKPLLRGLSCKCNADEFDAAKVHLIGGSVFL